MASLALKGTALQRTVANGEDKEINVSGAEHQMVQLWNPGVENHMVWTAIHARWPERDAIGVAIQMR